MMFPTIGRPFKMITHGFRFGKITSPNLNRVNHKNPFSLRYSSTSIPALLVLLIFTTANHTFAADVMLTPKLSVGGAYDDNLFYSTDDEVQSSIMTISPSVDLDYETLLSTFQFTADWDILNYLDESDLNRTNQYYQLTADHTFKQRWDTTADIEYSRDTTLNTYLQETGRVIDRIERDFLNARAKVSYNLTLVSGVSVNYRYQTASYAEDVYSDFDSHQGGLSYYHRLKNQVDTLSIGPGYYHRENDLNTVDSYSLNIGWKRDWSDISSSDAAIGARYATVKQDNAEDDNNWGARAHFDYTYEGIVWAAGIKYTHDLRTTADGTDVNVDNFYLSYSRLLTQRFGVGIDGGLVFSYKLIDRNADINDSRYYWFEPRLSYKLTKNLGVSLKYRYQNNVEFRDEGDQTRERNTIWLQFGYTIAYLL